MTLLEKWDKLTIDSKTEVAKAYFLNAFKEELPVTSFGDWRGVIAHQIKDNTFGEAGKFYLNYFYKLQITPAIVFKLKHKIQQFKTYYSTLRQVSKASWDLSMKHNVKFIHWHLGYGWKDEDYDIIWKELHKAHLIYANKLNKKYKMKVYNAGRKARKKTGNPVKK